MEEGVGVGEAAADGDAVDGCGVVGEEDFSFVAPAAEDAFDAAEFAIEVEEGGGVGLGEGVFALGACEGLEGIGFAPAVLEAEGLGEELGIDEAAAAGFDGEVVFAGGGAFLFDALAHAADFGFPVGLVASEGEAGLGEVGEGRGEGFEGGAGGGVAGDGAGAGEGLDFPELGALAVVVFVGWERIDEEAFVAVGAEAGVDFEDEAGFGFGAEEVEDGDGEALEAWEVAGAWGSDEDDIEVGAVVDFAAGEFAEADDGEGCFGEAGLADDDIDGVLEAGFGEGGEFGHSLVEVGEAEDIAEADAHEFGLVVAADPE